METTKIDLVYLWVDGNDPKWQEDKEIWQKKLGFDCSQSTYNCRFVDNQELKYSLRSVETNAPWINKIFIVTNDQIPTWLDTNHPKIKLVTHNEIMPAKALPTFNSEAIEACIMNIPDLSEYFLYANDDFFINRPITPSFFFDKNSKPIIRLVPQNWQEELINERLYLKNITYSINLIAQAYGKEYKYEPSHNIDPYRKSYLKECKEKFKTEFETTINRRFREPNSVQRAIYSFYSLIEKNCKLIKSDFREQNVYYNGQILYLKLGSPTELKDRLSTLKPYLFCINDNEASTTEERARLKNVLSAIYPQKMEWEKPEKIMQINPCFEDRKAKTIVFASDNNYCKYLGVAFQSLSEQSNKDELYDIIVFETDITDKNKRSLRNILPTNFNLRFFDITTYINEEIGIQDLKSTSYWSVSMYYRIFIPLLMRQYERVLYCDTDICFNSSLDELFKIDFQGNEILAVADTATPILNIIPDRRKHICQDLEISKPEKYFNSGIMMFNTKEINLDNYIEKVKNAYNKNLLYPDQDMLNIMFNETTKLISFKYNYQYGVVIFFKNYIEKLQGEIRNDFIEAKNNPVIIHYSDKRKPWHAPQEEWAEAFWEYARKTPFYEEILYANLNREIIPINTLKNLNLKGKIYYNYYRAKILASLTFGKKKKHYQNKRDALKLRVREIRKFSKL